jgi:hypothetical protein
MMGEFQIEVVDMDRQRIDKVSIRRVVLPVTSETESAKPDSEV